MKLLIVTQYYPPETGAPQNRLHELAIRLQAHGIEITVLTAMPNYPQMEIYEGYKGKRFLRETIDGIPIVRTGIYVSQKRSILPRLLNYFSFVFSSAMKGPAATGSFDAVLCESPPLFLGLSAYYIAKRKKAKFIFNVSDLWPESAVKLGLVTSPLMIKPAEWLEEWLYKKADLITGQTMGIVNNISGRFPEKKVYWLPNGVDPQFFDADSVTSKHPYLEQFPPHAFILLYAGIIGHAQGLEVILNAANKLKDNANIFFLIVGEGPEKERLIQLKNQYHLNRVIFQPGVPKKEMPCLLLACQAAIIPLKRLDLFKGAIPSKIFETLAMKKPILLGVEGEAADLFIQKGKAGMSFLPENDTDLAEKVQALYENPQWCDTFGNNGFHYVNEFFNRNKIAEDFAAILGKI